jgi:two-component system sensor histidine kinase GlrK
MERALANLVRNAVAVSRRGQCVRVDAGVEQRSGPGQEPGLWIRITVADEGPGVPPEIRDRLFDAFVTRPVPTTSKGLGVGLGLALASEVAHAHGGTLELVDREGPGTCFAQLLPLEAPREPPGPPPFATSGAASVLIEEPAGSPVARETSPT